MPIVKKKFLDVWIDRSADDLKMMKRNFENKEFHFSYFIAQQAVEKLFKILMSLKGVAFDKTHDLVELYQKVKNIYGDEVIFLDSYSLILNRLYSMYFDERYSFDRIIYQEGEIKELIDFIEILLNFTNSKIGK